MLSTSYPTCEIFHPQYEYVRPDRQAAEEQRMVSNFDGLFDDIRQRAPKELKQRQSVHFYEGDAAEKKIARAQAMKERAEQQLQAAIAQRDEPKKVRLTVTEAEAAAFEEFKRQQQQPQQQQRQ